MFRAVAAAVPIARYGRAASLQPHRRIAALLGSPRRWAAMSTGGAPANVAVICPAGSPALALVPRAEVPATFLVGNELETFSDRLQSIDALVFVGTGGDVGLLSRLFEMCPNVRWVHSFFAGVDSLAPFIRGGFGESPVPLTNGRGAFSESLGEYVMAAALHFNKRIPQCQANRADRRWDKFVMPVLQGKTMGFVGYGHIGQTCARLAKAFGMRVIAVRNDPSKSSPLVDEVFGVQDRLRLFKEADFVVSVLPGTPETVNFCGREEFAAMKPESVFISIGRGTVVDEVALADALRSGRIAGAALDVFKVEPLPEDSPLWGCDNLLMTAHNADFTEDYFKLGWGIWKQNYDALVAGRPFVTPVDKGAGY